jgi:hypothetical protein
MRPEMTLIFWSAKSTLVDGLAVGEFHEPP